MLSWFHASIVVLLFEIIFFYLVIRYTLVLKVLLVRTIFLLEVANTSISIMNKMSFCKCFVCVLYALTSKLSIVLMILKV